MLVSTWWRRKLRRRAIVVLLVTCVAAGATMAARTARSYHRGVIRDPLLSPFVIDVSLTSIRCHSECVLWSEDSSNGLDQTCRLIARQLNDQSLAAATQLVCNPANVLNLFAASVVCSTVSSLNWAGDVARIVLNLALVLSALVASANLYLVISAKDSMAESSPTLFETSDLLGQAEIKMQHDVYDQYARILRTLRVAIQIGALLGAILTAFATIAYPLMSENIHMSSMPLLNWIWHHSLASDPTSLNEGYFLLCSAAAAYLGNAAAAFLVLPPKLTASLSEQKTHLAETRRGRRARYDGLSDHIRLRPSVLNFNRGPADIILDDSVVEAEIARLITANVPPAMIDRAADQ